MRLSCTVLPVRTHRVPTGSCPTLLRQLRSIMINNLGAVATQGHSTLTRNVQLHDTVETQVSDSPERRSFNQDELDDIQTIVAEIIATNAPLTITQTKNFLKSESTHLTTLIDLPSEKATIRCCPKHR